MDISPLQSQSSRASTIPFEQLAKNSSVSEKDKVTEACKQFEAVLIRQMLTEARKTVITSGQTETSAKGIYDDMINNQMANSMSHSGGFGLAKSLEKQLVHQVLPGHSVADETDEPESMHPINFNNSTIH